MSRPPFSQRYCSYLLRLWQEPSGSGQRAGIWRFMLQDSQTGERHGFATLEHLVRHLNAQMNESESPNPQFNQTEFVHSQSDSPSPENMTQDDQTRQMPEEGQQDK